MKSILRKLTLCASLGASISAHAAFVPFPDGEFNAGQGTWGQAGPAAFAYPSSGGNPGGYGTMNANGPNWGVWVSSNNSGAFIPLASLGLVAGNGYTFKMDMQIQPGSNTNNLGELKLEWQGAPDTGDMPATYINGNWNTHSFPVIIPAGVTGIRVVPVANDNNFVGFDNIGFESVPYFVAPPPPPPPSDVVVLDRFNTASPRWGVPTFNGTGNSGSITWSNTDGNPPGATVLTATNPVPSGGNGFYTYTATGVNFGTGPVEITFDVRGSLVGSALHVTYNGNQVFDIQNAGLNPTTFTNVKRTFQLNQGFTGTTTFTLQFQIAMGPVPGGGGAVTVDNLIVKTNLPASATPFAATIKTGKLVGWQALEPLNAYQPQSSTDGVVFNDFGPLIIGNTQTSSFDSPGAPFYRVIQSAPFIEDVAFNGTFTLEFPPNSNLFDGWKTLQTQPPTRLATGGRGDDGPCARIKANNVEATGGEIGPNGSELQQNTRNAFFDFNQDPEPGTLTPGMTYKLEFWAKQISSEAGYVQNYSVQFLDENGGVLLNSGALNFVPTVGGDWTKFGTTLVAPSGATSALIQIVGSTGADAVGFGEVLIDDVSLTTTGFTPNPVPLAATSTPNVEVSWLAALGRDYQVQSSLGLTSWQPLGGVVSGEGSIMAAYDSMVDPKKFYRVGRLP